MFLLCFGQYMHKTETTTHITCCNSNSSNSSKIYNSHRMTRKRYVQRTTYVHIGRGPVMRTRRRALSRYCNSRSSANRLSDACRAVSMRVTSSTRFALHLLPGMPHTIPMRSRRTYHVLTLGANAMTCMYAFVICLSAETTCSVRLR